MSFENYRFLKVSCRQLTVHAYAPLSASQFLLSAWSDRKALQMPVLNSVPRDLVRSVKTIRYAEEQPSFLFKQNAKISYNLRGVREKFYFHYVHFFCKWQKITTDSLNLRWEQNDCGLLYPTFHSRHAQTKDFVNTFNSMYIFCWLMTLYTLPSSLLIMIRYCAICLTQGYFTV